MLHSVEVSVYLDKDFVCPGTGSLLYSHLFQAIANSDVHVAMAGIALPNEASVALQGTLTNLAAGVSC